jgi:prephenate dehydratase
MIKIATLGPKGTFTELAAKKYIERFQSNAKIVFYPTTAKSFHAVGKECDLGIIPIENTLDGYVQSSLDLLLGSDLKIMYELILPIQFSFVSNSLDISEVQKVYAQFKTQGQCSKFLEQFASTQIVITESNGASFEQVKKGILGEGAVIPKHILKTEDEFPLIVKNVADSEDNETRFIVISKDPVLYEPGKRYKTSIAIITNDADKPGILSEILNEFSRNEINLTAIISRPTKRMLGKYHFFIDKEGHYPQTETVKQTIDRISENYTIVILGSYSLI